ncbi:hypothetical protein DTO006G1_2110 [Penicillium roqueforti]|nr:hypothetical protein CBS147337_8476 [Penicillium roqueforti]KAI2676033.1 hypothetical protein CBS147355_6214 [Penicillium roqueforti]KAI2679281.1 hypothetical protein LCP963914a_7380 [Penicillium roqueforti]KAI2721139.1 hypothetical protein CBS147354_5821 [Penicillium roqueforti]KAI2762971.1 hypothetical protein DTO006G1_2110 [Penicillium roqueforti]
MKPKPAQYAASSIGTNVKRKSLDVRASESSDSSKCNILPRIPLLRFPFLLLLLLLLLPSTSRLVIVHLHQTYHRPRIDAPHSNQEIILKV